MAAQFCSKIADPGEGDLVAYRDAVLTYAQALSQGEPFWLEAGQEARELASWLGIRFQVGGPGGDLELNSLADTKRFPAHSLASFRAKGYLAETMFAALVRSSYGPESEGYFPTQSELKVTFEDYPLREGQALWDEDYLERCQVFFMEELTPNQLMRAVVGMLAPEQRAGLDGSLQRWAEVLPSALFLVGETCESLLPLSRLLQSLLEQKTHPQLAPLVDLSEWTRDSVGEVAKGEVSACLDLLFPGFEESAQELVYALGPDYFRWRSGLVNA